MDPRWRHGLSVPPRLTARPVAELAARLGGARGRMRRDGERSDLVARGDRRLPALARGGRRGERHGLPVDRRVVRSRRHAPHTGAATSAARGRALLRPGGGVHLRARPGLGQLHAPRRRQQLLQHRELCRHHRDGLRELERGLECTARAGLRRGGGRHAADRLWRDDLWRDRHARRQRHLHVRRQRGRPHRPARQRRARTLRPGRCAHRLRRREPELHHPMRQRRSPGHGRLHHPRGELRGRTLQLHAREPARELRRGVSGAALRHHAARLQRHPSGCDRPLRRQRHLLVLRGSGRRTVGPAAQHGRGADDLPSARRALRSRRQSPPGDEQRLAGDRRLHPPRHRWR